MEVEAHPDLRSLACLLGTWRGEGDGFYPTIEPFRYSEEVVFDHTGKPFLTYRQTTVNLTTGLPGHAEVGYWRSGGPGRVEIVLAHPTGITELLHGTIDHLDDGVALHVRSTDIGLTNTAKSVVSIERSLWVERDVLRYDVAMSAVGQPHQPHLSATLRRV